MKNMTYINKLPKKSRKDDTEKRKERKKFYNSKIWLDLRERKLKKSPICEICIVEGRVTAANQVHHEKGIMNYDVLDYEKATDYDSLVSICSQCHGKIHGKNNKDNNNNSNDNNK